MPWRTLTFAESTGANGDTFMLGNGDFDEEVQVSLHSTRWIAETNRLAVTRQFRFDAATNWLEGVKLTKACDAGYRTWGAFTYLDSGAHYTTITNCWISDQPYVTATNFVFNSPSGATNRATSTSVDFVTAGFKDGSKVNVNGVSYSNTTRGAQFRFVNQHAKGFVTNITATAITFTNNLDSETNLSTWAFIAAGDTVDQMYGVKFTASGGGGPSNCVITSCVFSNLTGQPITVNGNNNTVTNCDFVRIIGNSFITYSGYNLYFFSNYFHDSPLQAYYSDTEVVDHTGGSFYDYYVRTVIGGTLQTWNTNIWFVGNWMEDIEGASLSINHATLSDPGDFKTIRIDGNVFIGIAGELDGGMDEMYIRSNTFYRCSFQEGHTSPVTIGGLDTYTNDAVTFTHNLMVANGDHESHTNEGYPTIVFTTTRNISSNYVCGPEVSHWNAMPSWPSTNGPNGGDPMFVGEYNPTGPDGRPFTDDDGLRLHPRSPALGIGALPVAVANSTRPYAFFRPLVASNFLDYRGTNFNLNWHTGLYAFERTTWDRVWDYGDALLNLPQTVAFTATNSISGDWYTNKWVGIKDFRWDFGDGSYPVWTKWPDVSHTFVTTGQVTVTLTVTNWAGNTSTHSRNYRILPGTNFANDIFYARTNGSDANPGTYASPLRTVTNGMTRLGPGDYLVLLPGNFDEWCDPIDGSGPEPPTNGTKALPITVVGLGARVEGVRAEGHYWTWEGIEMGGDITMTSSNRDSYFHIRDLVNGITLRNCRWNGNFTLTNGVGAVLQAASGGIGGTNHSMFNCHIDRIIGHDANSIIHFSGATNILIDGCIDTYSGGQADVFKLYGGDSTWRRHYSYEFAFTNNNHSDWMSFGIESTQPTGNILVEQCWAECNNGTNGAIANNGNGDVWLQCTNLTVRNCVFINFHFGFNPLGFNGAKIYNNLFYRSPQTNINTMVMGVNKSSLAEDFRNNIFFENFNLGSDTNRGWYGNGYLVPSGVDTNISFLHANYNFVCGTNFFPKEAAPPDDWAHWAVTGTEANGINGGNPQWVNAVTFDFRLMTNSPLAGTGATGTTTNDFWGDEWEGGVPSIGPFQLQTEAAVQAAEGMRATVFGPVTIQSGVTIR